MQLQKIITKYHMTLKGKQDSKYHDFFFTLNKLVQRIVDVALFNGFLHSWFFFPPNSSVSQNKHQTSTQLQIKVNLVLPD